MRTRKEAYLEHPEHRSESELRVSLGDKLFNARALLRDYLLIGDEIGARFQSGRDGQLWYYRQLADLLPGRMARELSEVVNELDKAVMAR